MFEVKINPIKITIDLWQSIIYIYQWIDRL